MKLIIVLLFAGLMQVSAAGFAQKVTLNQRGVLLKEALRQIRLQSGYNIIYNTDLLNNSIRINVNLKDASIDDAMKSVLSDQKIIYSIEDNTVVLEEKTPSFLDKLILRFAAIDVRGRIMDDKGLPLPGATVRVKGVRNVTITGTNGEFKLNGVNENAIIIVDYVGYTSESRPAKQNMGDIMLSVSNSQLDQVQVIAYGVATKRLNTGSQAGIKAADIEKQVISNPLEALIGRVAGLDITQQSGTAGTGFNIRIRGINSLRPTANEPLILIDGIPYQSNSPVNPDNLPGGSTQISPLSSFNPADVASIDVLKDADATAIYGSRGANGVIIITTKKGLPGKTTVNFNVSSGVGEIARKAKLLSGKQYLDMRYEAFRNDGADFKKSAYAWDLNSWDTTKFVDWQDKLLGGTAHFTDGQVSVLGGNEGTSFNFGAGYRRQTSVYPTELADQKYNGRLAINHVSDNKKFKAQFAATYGAEENKVPGFDLVPEALSLAPVAPELYNGQGKLNWDNNRLLWLNPLARFEATYGSETNTFTSNATFSYQLPKGITLKTLLGYNNNTYHALSLIPSTFYNPAQEASLGNFYRTSTESTAITKTWNIEPQLNYTAKIGTGILNVLMGTTFQSTTANLLTINGSGYKDDDLLYNLSGAASTFGNRTVSEYKYNAVFARIGYNIGNKYLLNLTGRRDGSSRFASGRQFGNFGALGAAWIFSEEPVIKKILPFLSYGKLRGSYGLTGNDQIGNYSYFQLYSSTNLRYGSAAYGGEGVLTPDKLENSTYRWETNKKAEGAIELGFFKDRILLTANYYQNRSSDMLVDYPLAATTGFSGIIRNLPALIQNSGWEFELSTINLKRKDFSWSSSFNISLPKNKLLRYDGLENSSYSNTYAVGYPLSIAKTLLPYDVNPQTGVKEVRNAAGQVTTTLALKDAVNIVDLFRKYYGGLNNSFIYKGFSLDVFLQFSKQKGSYTNPASFRSNDFGLVGFIGNIPSELYDNRWSTPGQTGAQFQKLTQDLFRTQPGAKIPNLGALDPGYYVDITYLRLKNLSFSYTLPTSFRQKLKLQNARIFIQGQNLLTLTDYPGMDPENQSRALPPLKTLTAGIQVTF
ncbi:SusC/RagA family TonB-linked outer membrane protein [Pedobacter sp. KBW06]|uniref:SusC/RagA family TonB-linked outer membrane protein n=1 Tax=Pedobacter sp. KBW06 TaxID=2153359 RepID=UPI00131507D8|nr:SusC/RagA family TonB-linked outer membrane protein [Pedobacter sp. KBW06]